MISNLQERLLFNHEQNIVLLNFNRLHLNTQKELEHLSQSVHDFLEELSKKTGGRVECLVNYDQMNIKEQLLDSYVEICISNTQKYFSEVSRHGSKDFMQKLDKVFQKKNITPNIFDEHIGQYILREKIGSGTFGTVRLGICKRTGIKVAVKVLDMEMLNEFVGQEFVEREIEIHSNLNHRNIAKLLKTYQTEDKTYLVLEYLNNGKLESYIEYKKLEESKARKYFGNLVDAVEYLHQRGVTHRDIHPGNILISKTDEAKLIDFGVADHFTPKKKFTLFTGKSQYAAPEMILQRYEGPTVDVWSLGACLFKMLTGFEPFHFSQDTLARKFAIPLEDEKLSGECVDLVLRILTIDPLKRITIEQIKEHPWMKKMH